MMRVGWNHSIPLRGVLAFGKSRDGTRLYAMRSDGYWRIWVRGRFGVAVLCLFGARL